MIGSLGERQRWWLLASGWAVLFVLGIAGSIRQSDALGLDTAFLDHLYFTLQLAVLDYAGPSEDINWMLQVVRFAAPLMAAGTLLQSASVVFREQFTRWQARRASDHTVVIGLGPVGTRLVEALVAEGRSVVAVAADGDAASVATVGRLGVPVVDGNPGDASTLLAARCDRATRVVAATEQDITNVAVAAALRELERPAGTSPLRCAVRLADGELAHLLRTTELRGDGHLRLEFFNVHERAAHAVLELHPVEPDPEPHVVVLGVGQFGGELVLAAAQTWAERGVGPLRVTMVDRRATGRYQALAMRHPALDTAIAATTIDLDIGQPTAASVAEFDRVLAERSPTLVVVAFDDDSLSWSSALFVRRRLVTPVDVVVRTDADSGFGRHLGVATGGERAVGTIVPFPFLDRACTTDLIEGGVREQLARTIHEDFLRHAEPSHPMRRPWDELSDLERESSRSAADGVVERLDEIGARLEPLRRWTGDHGALDDAAVELLAAAEHRRWCDERRAQGWVWGERRDDAARTNPLLLAWDELGEDARKRNRASTRALPELLARAGFEIVRP